MIPCRMCHDGSANCDKHNINYTFKCMFPGCKGIYIGETSKSGFTRGNQHQLKYVQDDAVDSDSSTSWMREHQIKFHNNLPENFKMEVVQVFRDAMSRQISEAVRIEHAIRDGYIFFPMKRVSGILQALYLYNLRSNQKSNEALVDKTGVITWDFFKVPKRN